MVQGHATPKLDLETRRRHQSRHVRSSRFTSWKFTPVSTRTVSRFEERASEVNVDALGPAVIDSIDWGPTQLIIYVEINSGVNLYLAKTALHRQVGSA